jgi:hypothetical protein
VIATTALVHHPIISRKSPGSILIPPTMGA